MTNTNHCPGYGVGMAYVPMQEFVGLYDDETAFERGTLFRALDLPFTARVGDCP